MVKTYATVIEKKDNKAVLEFSREKMCGCCSNMFCGAKKQNIIRVDDPLGTAAGDKVQIGVESRIFVGLSVLVFLIPALVFIAGVYLLQRTGVPLSFAAGVLLVVFYFLALKFIMLDKLKKGTYCKMINKV